MNKNKIKLSTIESAIVSFARVSMVLNKSRILGKYDAYSNFMSDIIYQMDGYTEKTGVGLLWNGLTEITEKDVCMGLSRDDENHKPLIIQADSGGLQMMTLGLMADENVKKEIYERQADFSNYAMSFDKMPILIDESMMHTVKKGGASQGLKMNHSVKYFVSDMSYDAGRESGFNIKDQIDVFRDRKSKSKVLPIIQGFAFEDYFKYAEGVYSVFNEMDEETKKDYYSYIGGISIAGTSLNSYFNMFDVFIRAADDLTVVPKEHRNFIHILGLGGSNRTGILYALNDNFYHRDMEITYDSTSRTSSNAYGRRTVFRDMGYCDIKEENVIKKTTVKLGRESNPRVMEFLEDIRKMSADAFKKNLDIDVNALTPEEFRDRFSPWREDGLLSIADFTEHYGEVEGMREHLHATALNAFLHWMIELQMYLDETLLMEKGRFDCVSDRQYREAMEKLYTMKDLDDYKKNREWFKLKLKGKRMPAMTVVKDVNEFNEIVNNSKGIDDEEW